MTFCSGYFMILFVVTLADIEAYTRNVFYLGHSENTQIRLDNINLHYITFTKTFTEFTDHRVMYLNLRLSF